LYFKLKDSNGVLECIAWPRAAAAFPQVEVGADIVAYGKIGTYRKKSIYQLDASSVELAGVGALHRKFEELRRKLQLEGLFDEERKRRLPSFPFHVALVGSRAADGTRDFRTQARQRAPHVRIRLFETPVQGAHAAPEVVKAIEAAARSGAEMLFLVRGGGSYEDLFLFNDERIVRALAASAIPTVAAIGHESDMPLVDFVADKRAATPLQAANFLPNCEEIRGRIRSLHLAAERALKAVLERKARALDRFGRNSPLRDPAIVLSTPRQDLDRVSAALSRRFGTSIERKRRMLVKLERPLFERSPRVALAEQGTRIRAARLALKAARVKLVWRHRARLEHADRALRQCSPATALSNHRKRVGTLAELLGEVSRQRAIDVRKAPLRRLERELGESYARYVYGQRERFERATRRLHEADPEALLGRGYAIVFANSKVLRDPGDVAAGTLLDVRVARGSLHARVESEGRDGGEQTSLF
jgi:exodeoxyribonuclease VII large subunit